MKIKRCLAERNALGKISRKIVRKIVRTAFGLRTKLKIPTLNQQEAQLLLGDRATRKHAKDS